MVKGQSLSLCLLLLVMSIAGCNGVNSSTKEAAPDGYVLAWADEFNKPGRPDPNNWTFERGFVRNEELQWYQPENASCRDGLLVIDRRRIAGRDRSGAEEREDEHRREVAHVATSSRRCCGTSLRSR